MKNKKGFTLVELLAVIAILAVILLLIVPNIVNMFTNGKKDAFVRQVQTVWNQAQKQYGADLTVDQEKTSYCDSTFSSLGCSPLSINESDVKYYTEIDIHGKLTAIGVSDNNYCYYTNSPESMDIDKDELNKKKVLSCTSSTCSCVEATTSSSSNNG